MNAAADRIYGLPIHPQRQQLINEAHARPAHPCPPGADVSRLVMISSEAAVDTDTDRAHIAELAAQYGCPPPTKYGRHHTVECGPAQVVWERHTEFSAYTIYREVSDGPRFTQPAIHALPAQWVSAIPGHVLAAVHVAITPAQNGTMDPDMARAAFGRSDFTASKVRGGAASVTADFRAHADGFTRMMVFDSSPDDTVRGRMIQKLLEIETYRLAAMLALPVARRAGLKLGDLEKEVETLSARLSVAAHMSRDRDLLQRVSQIAGAAEELTAKSAFRFRAAQAYYRLVSERIARLREDRYDGYERLGVFMERRLAPAMRTCEAVSERQIELAQRVDRAVRLLATRVEVKVEEQNAGQLTSMNNRAKLQLRLQQTVEGLSIIALSYYGVGLVSYIAKGLAALGAPLPSPAVIAGVATPVIAFSAWFTLKRWRKNLQQEQMEDPEEPLS